jgi:hypothetical protein
VSKRVDKLAGKLATAMLEQAGVTKSEASAAQVMPYAVGLTPAVVSVEKSLKATIRQHREYMERTGRPLDQNGEKTIQFAERYSEWSGNVVPGHSG